jgi:hypothetical protein
MARTPRPGCQRRISSSVAAADSAEWRPSGGRSLDDLSRHEAMPIGVGRADQGGQQVERDVSLRRDTAAEVVTEESTTVVPRVPAPRSASRPGQHTSFSG